MLTQVLTSQLRGACQCLRQQTRRNLGVSAVLYQKTAEDPVQQLFVQKVREYAQKSKAAGGKLVDVTPDAEKNLANQLLRLEKQYNAKDQDMTKFPTFAFQDQAVETMPTSDGGSGKDLPL